MTLSPLASPSIFAATGYAPASLPMRVRPSSVETRIGVKLTSSPLSERCSISSTSPALTRYCFPPVRITAYIALAFQTDPDATGPSKKPGHGMIPAAGGQASRSRRMMPRPSQRSHTSEKASSSPSDTFVRVKKVSEGLLEAFSEVCDRCEGRGIILLDLDA